MKLRNIDVSWTLKLLSGGALVMSMVACGGASSTSGDSSATGGMGGAATGGSDTGGAATGGSDTGGSDGSGGASSGPCTSGTFDDDGDPTTACAPWSTCAKGTFVSVQGSATKDRVCKPCAADTYTSGPNQSECLPQEACDAGTVQLSPGTAQGLPVCEACQPGEYCAGGEAPKVTCGSGTTDDDDDPSTACVATCSVLVLDDATTSNDTLFEAALEEAGLTVTYVTDGAMEYAAAPAAGSFSAIFVSPGTTYDYDMPLEGQDAIAAAVNAGTGLVMTEWSAYQVSEGRYQSLAPFILLPRDSGNETTSEITATLTGHYIWTGIPETFTTVAVGWNQGSTLTNDGVSLGTCSACSGSVGAVRDSESAGRVVQLAHAGDYEEYAWATDANLLKMTVNSVKWAARCE